jgi:MFS transporter, putative metabolite:H+ symporter
MKAPNWVVSTPRNQIILIVVAALGYFVDIYDLVLFQVIKDASLIDLGLNKEQIKAQEVILFSWQMSGMLVGGILWGIMGDKLGRLKVLFGSILMYSLANIANAYVWDLESYAAIRFVAGLGLAGELGAGITLIAEIMSKENRGYGTMIVVTFGALGAVVAALLADRFHWKTSYWVGGLMGLALLLLRVGTIESGMFKNLSTQHSSVKRGNILLLFNKRSRLLKYLACIGIGLPVWFVVGVLINLSGNYFKDVLGLAPAIKTGTAVMYCYIGLSVGDLLGGVLSQIFKNRLKVIMGYLIFCTMVCFVYLFGSYDAGTFLFYTICLLLGTATGYWALFVTVAAEQFGTNIRATVASTVPNFVRGAVVPITMSFKYLNDLPNVGTIQAALYVGSVCIAIAVISTLYLSDTFGKSLDYVED